MGVELKREPVESSGSLHWFWMGKTEEEQREAVGFEVPNQNVENQWVWCGNSGYGCCGSCGKLIGVRCVLVLLLSAAVFLSALFWLPPFLKFADHQDLDLDAYKGGVFFFFFFFKYFLIFGFVSILGLWVSNIVWWG